MHKIYSFCLLLIFSCARNEDNINIDNIQSDAIVLMNSDSIKKPIDPNNEEIQIGKVKIYLENTLSMYGYLPYLGKGGVITDFRNTMNTLIRTSKTVYDKDNVELLLINNIKDYPINIDNNLDKIDKQTLKSKFSIGIGSSDFDILFDKVLNDWEEDEILVLIADFIYSPRGKDPLTGLDNLKGEITEAFQTVKNSEIISVNIIHLESDFHGIYYDIKNDEHDGIKNRPYYIFIIGSEDNVKKYSEKIIPQIKGFKLKHNYQLSPSVKKIENFSALPFTLNKGQFASNGLISNSSQIKSVTVKANLDQSSIVQLAVSIDLSDVPVSEEYLLDIDNYSFNNDKIKIIDIGKIDDKQIQLSNGTEENINPSDIQNVKNSTHVFLLSFPSTYKDNIELSLDKNMPIWIDNVSIKAGEDDRDIKTNILKQTQTYGFNYIVEGIFNAQKAKNPQNKYFQISLDIGQEKSVSGIGTIIGWIIVLLFLIVLTIIILKNKQRK